MGDAPYPPDDFGAAFDATAARLRAAVEGPARSRGPGQRASAPRSTRRCASTAHERVSSVPDLPVVAEEFLIGAVAAIWPTGSTVAEAVW